MNRKFRNLTIAIASGALLAGAGAVVAEVPNGGWIFADKDDADVEAFIGAFGDFNEVDVWVECAPFGEGSSSAGTYVEFYSWHPDKVKLKKNKGSIEQGQKDNQAGLYIETGTGTLQRENYLLCDKIEVSGDVKTKKTPVQGSFEGSAKNCVCDQEGDDDCADYPAQIAQIAMDCADKKNVKGDFDEGVVKKASIKGKGDGSAAPN